MTAQRRGIDQLVAGSISGVQDDPLRTSEVEPQPLTLPYIQTCFSSTFCKSTWGDFHISHSWPITYLYTQYCHTQKIKQLSLAKLKGCLGSYPCLPFFKCDSRTLFSDSEDLESFKKGFFSIFLFKIHIFRWFSTP